MLDTIYHGGRPAKRYAKWPFGKNFAGRRRVFLCYWSTNAAFCTTIKQMPNIKSAITPEITWIGNKANKLEGWHFK